MEDEYYHLQPHVATPKMGNLGPYIGVACINLHFHLMGKKILGADDFTLAIAIGMVAFIPHCRGMLAH